MARPLSVPGTQLPPPPGLTPRALVPCLVHPNAYLASQALSCLLHVTDEDAVFPWHDPPQAPGGRGPRAGPYAAAWRGM